MSGSIELYHFGDCGSFDEFNPSKIMSNKYAGQVLFLLSQNSPFSLTLNDIASELNLTFEDLKSLINEMKNINMIFCEKEKYRLGFPVFVKSDIPVLKQIKNIYSEPLFDKLKDMLCDIDDFLSKTSLIDGYSLKELRYHVISNWILDGSALDFFSTKKVFATSKEQEGNRNYLLLGYESAEELDEFSKGLLCSSNNLSANKVTFNSFGDGIGSRVDLYRYLRNVEMDKHLEIYDNELNATFDKIKKDDLKEVVQELSCFIKKIHKSNISVEALSVDESKMFCFLSQLGYLEEEKDAIKFKVPVFAGDDLKVLNEISDFVLGEIELTVKAIYKEIQNNCLDLTAIKHQVSFDEVANELWHIIFGGVLERMINEDIIGDFEGVSHGRYLQAVYIK